MRARWGEALFPDVDHPGSEIVAPLAPREEDLVVVKNTSGVFTATNLELLLQNMGIEQLVVCGVVTNMCVEGAARTGAELGFDVFLVSDACAAWSQEIHDATLRSFELLFGHVVPTDRLIEEIEKSV
jgi:nicotinamidase-related amidase